MCYRYALGLEAPDAMQRFTSDYPYVRLDEWVQESAFQAAFNIGPTYKAPVIRRKLDEEMTASGNVEPLVMHTMQFKLVPNWRLEEEGDIHNIPAVSIATGTGMTTALRGTNRCVVVCQGYFVWDRDKVKHFIKHEDGKLMLMAGLYDIATRDRVEPLASFAIITIDASNGLTELHDKQPVILSTQAEIDAWLDTPSWTEEVAQILEPHGDYESPLIWYPVRTARRGELSAPDLIEPVEPAIRTEADIAEMFAKQAEKTTPTKARRTSHQQSSGLEVSPKASTSSVSHIYPEPGVKRAPEESDPETNTTPKKRRPLKDAEHSESRIVASPSPTKQSKQSPSKTKASPRKKGKADKAEGCSKLTDFFPVPTDSGKGKGNATR